MESKKQHVFTTTLFGIGLIICIYLFYAMFRWMFDPSGLSDPTQANNFFIYGPLSVFGLISGVLLFGFGAIFCGVGFISGIYDVLE